MSSRHLQVSDNPIGLFCKNVTCTTTHFLVSIPTHSGLWRIQYFCQLSGIVIMPYNESAIGNIVTNSFSDEPLGVDPPERLTYEKQFSHRPAPKRALIHLTE